MDIVLKDSFLNTFIADKRNELLVAHCEAKEPITLKFCQDQSHAPEKAAHLRIIALTDFIQKIARLNSIPI